MRVLLLLSCVPEAQFRDALCADRGSYNHLPALTRQKRSRVYIYISAYVFTYVCVSDQKAACMFIQ